MLVCTLGGGNTLFDCYCITIRYNGQLILICKSCYDLLELLELFPEHFNCRNCLRAIILASSETCLPRTALARIMCLGEVTQ